jgi:hypothetical protein
LRRAVRQGRDGYSRHFSCQHAKLPGRRYQEPDPPAGESPRTARGPEGAGRMARRDRNCAGVRVPFGCRVFD